MLCKGLPASDSSQPDALAPPDAPGLLALHPEVGTVKVLKAGDERMGQNLKKGRVGREKSLLRKQKIVTKNVILWALESLTKHCKYLHWGRWTLKGAPYRNRENKAEEQS